MNASGKHEKKRRFAWDGFSFYVPDDWHMSWYKIHPRLSSVRMEDDVAVRLEMEWSRRLRAPDPLTALKNRSAFAASSAGKGISVEAIEGMPPGWLASLYSMPEKRFMAAALADIHGHSFSCRVRMHFERTGRRAPIEAIRSLADGFRLHDSGRAPWEVFDSAFECAAAFKLVRTAFQSGSRLFVLEWRMRRLFIWFFSLAGQALKNKPLENWCAEYLNNARCFPARRFATGEEGLLRTEHKRAYPLGHIDEIARRCFNYESGCRLLPEANQIVLYVFNYRSHEDVATLDLRLPGAE